MHANNLRWMQDVKATYPRFFKGTKVLELGSGGGVTVIRPLFEKPADYIGVDIAAGINVDLVQRAHATDFVCADYFDVIICLSMFEHDPFWRLSLSHNIYWLKPGGLIIGCHGVEGNKHHGPEPWAIVPKQEFLDHVATLPLGILDAFMEEERYGPDCAGCYDWVMTKLLH